MAPTPKTSARLSGQSETIPAAGAIGGRGANLPKPGAIPRGPAPQLQKPAPSVAPSPRPSFAAQKPRAGGIATHRFQLDLSKLAAPVRERLAACISGRAQPQPVWAIPAALDESWKISLPLGLAIFLAMALIDGDATLRWPWMGGWFLAAMFLAAGAAGFWRRKSAVRLGFAPGTYLFARDLIDARESVCTLYSFDLLTEVRPMTAGEGMKQGESGVDFVFGRKTVGIRLPGKETAQVVINKFLDARELLLAGLEIGDWNKVGTLDPLLNARQSEGWNHACVPLPITFVLPSTLHANTGLGPLGISPDTLSWGLIAGVIAAPLLWFAGNAGREALAFSRARSSDTVEAWEEYLKREDPSHYLAVKQDYLPKAALRHAKSIGSATSLRNVIATYPGTSAAGEGVAALHGIYSQAVAQVQAETSDPAQEIMIALLRWLDEHRTNQIPVRFGQSSAIQMRVVDDFIEEETVRRQLRNPITPIGPSLSQVNIARRENELLRVLRAGLESILSPDVITLYRGEPFSGTGRGFDEPTIALSCYADPTAQFIPDLDTGKAYLALAFNVELNIVVPGAKPFTQAFQVNFVDKIPKKSGHGNLYDEMLLFAFEETQQAIAGSLFPRHRPQREVATIAIGPAPGAPAAQAQVFTATGFCISPDGFIVTARHFTSEAKTFKVVTKSGTVEARLVMADRVNDVAILKSGLRSLQPLAIRTSETVKLGETVATIGFPQTQFQGREPKIGRGEISSLSGMMDTPALFQISVPIQPGNSGGPLFDMNGNVVGIIVSTLRQSQNVNYALKSKHLLELCRRIPELSDLARPTLGPPPAFEETVDKVRQATVLLLGYE